MDIRPLTRSTKAGNLYQRSEQVEQQIQFWDNLLGNEVLAHARDQDKNGPQYVQEEVLVYWMREHHRRGNAQLAGDLAEVLLTRSTKYIQSKLRRLGQDTARDAEQDVVGKLFGSIFDLDSDRGDYLQVRYWDFLKALITNAFRQYAQRQNRTEYLSPSNEDVDFSSDDDVTENVGAPELATTDVGFEQREAINAALTAIEEPYRTVFVLRYYYDWPSESKDPAVLTISSYFGKDPRTIRNWLKRAEQALSEWRNEERS